MASYFSPCCHSFLDHNVTLIKVVDHACRGAYLPESLGEDVSA